MTGSSASTHKPMDPEAVKARIRAEHLRLRGKLEDVEARAKALSSGAVSTSTELLAAVRVLATALQGHLALEEEILIPLVRVSPAFGAARADEMLKDHVEQRVMLESVIDDLESVRADDVVAVGALELVRAVRDDVRMEEEMFLADDIELGVATV